MQKLCVVEYWRGAVNLVHGPFENREAADRYKERRADHLGDRSQTELEVRVLVGTSA